MGLCDCVNVLLCYCGIVLLRYCVIARLRYCVNVLLRYCGIEFDVFNDAEVVAVAFGADAAVVDGLQDGAAGLVAVGAVGEAAVVQHAAHLGKEMAEFLRGEVHHAKLLDAGGVDEIA